MLMKIYLNRNWQFTECWSQEFLNFCSDEGVREVILPHTVKETPYHYFDESVYQMVSGYRRKLEVPESWNTKRIFLTFEGAAHDAKVYLNGNLIAEHHCGYTAFQVELKDLNFGQMNQICVQLDSRETLNIPPFGHVIDYMTYGGLYRDVYLEVKEQIYIEDVFACSRKKNLFLEMKLNEACAAVCKVWMKRKEETEYQLLKETEINQINTLLQFDECDVDLWDIDHPNLVDLKIQLLSNEQLMDEKKLVFGFRDSEFKKDGFYLNGRKVKIRGLNRHQSYPYVGYAMPASMQRLDADILKKKLGCNAVRTSHYPQSHDFISRCDELGLLVFTEIPGWQHIGDESWKKQACQNVKDMVIQYRNHPAIILWGVRINESQDDDEFYKMTNQIAHELDPTRPTGGVRNFRKSHLFEDVYTYNDFVHEGSNRGCEAKKRITSDVNKAYLVTEYNGHMFPTKSFDSESHRTSHALRHAKVLNDVASQEDIAGSFGWCFADYNTHRDFGSGDRICYHGVLDMFRNPKLAAYVYASQNENEIVLETSSEMEIGEQPASKVGLNYLFTNADSVKLYKNNRFIQEYSKSTDYPYLKHGPVLVDDLVGDLLVEDLSFSKEQSEGTKGVLNAVAQYGAGHMPLSVLLKIPKLLLKYKMTVEQVTALYTKYIGNWGENAVQYRFDAIKNGQVVKSIVKAPMTKTVLEANADHTVLIECHTYDAALVQIRMKSDTGQLLHYSNDAVVLKTEGEIELIGPCVLSLLGGQAGTYVKSKGPGKGKLTVSDSYGNESVIEFAIEKEKGIEYE